LVLVHSLYAAACGTWPITLQTDLQPTDNDVRNQENRTLMQKCSSCVIVISSFISGTGSKNGVLGGDKHKFIMIIWGGGNAPPRHHPQEITILLLHRQK